VQLFSQLAAAIVIVLSGIKILQIDLAGINLSFDWWHTSIPLFSSVISIVFPADFITIIWIVVIINAVNWMYGMDSIGEAMTIIAAVTTALLSVRAGLIGNAIIALSLAGGVLGFLPFNIYPSKIIGGTAGATGNGFLLAVLSIMSGAKFTNAIILLLFPIFDMVWVMIYRLNKHRNEPFLKRPFISGKVHFHHRLMDLGLSQRQILFVEIIIISTISGFGVYFSGFSNTFIFLVVSLCILTIIFAIVSIYMRRREKNVLPTLRKAALENEKSAKPSDDDIPPEQRYAY
jgi:UDP-GlcNAc:undecaprenyl-phosphate GlcNAc-1-phosphate transferase